MAFMASGHFSLYPGTISPRIRPIRLYAIPLGATRACGPCACLSLRIVHRPSALRMGRRRPIFSASPICPCRHPKLLLSPRRGRQVPRGTWLRSLPLGLLQHADRRPRRLRAQLPRAAPATGRGGRGAGGRGCRCWWRARASVGAGRVRAPLPFAVCEVLRSPIFS